MFIYEGAELPDKPSLLQRQDHAWHFHDFFTIPESTSPWL